MSATGPSRPTNEVDQNREVRVPSPGELQLQLGERVRALRVRHKLRQNDLASKAGVSLRSVVRLETGRGSTVESLMRVLHSLGTAEQALNMLAPTPTVSPLALMRRRPEPRRVRLQKPGHA